MSDGKQGNFRKKRLTIANMGTVGPSAADIMALETKARSVTDSLFNTSSFTEVLPVFACLLWIFIGTIFYALRDGFGWVFGLYMSVNIGWSIGWVVPIEVDGYNDSRSKMFSAIHTSIGVLFVGIAVLYMAQKMTENKESWMSDVLKQKQVEVAAATEGYYDDIVMWFTYYLPKYKVIGLLILWIIFGVMFLLLGVEEFDFVTALDFVLSTLSGAGYISLPLTSPKWQYVVLAIYTATGVPITAIAVGMILSLILTAEDTSIYENIVAPVTHDELNFMKMFGIEDGDGTLDCREFIILTVVRIGAAPPDLVRQINNRFKSLDRKGRGRIKYEDIVTGFKRPKVTGMRLQTLTKRYAFGTFSQLTPDGKKMMTKVMQVRPYDETIHREERSETGNEESHLEAGHACAEGGCHEIGSGKNDSISSVGHEMTAVLPAREANIDIKSNSSPCDGPGFTSVQMTIPTRESEPRVKIGGGERRMVLAIELLQLSQKLDSNTRNKDMLLHRAETARSETSKNMSSKKLASSRGLDISRDMSYRPIDVAGEIPCCNSIMTGLRRVIGKYIMDPYVLTLIAWILWLAAGTIFLMVHTGYAFPKALYRSISIGYGIFWVTFDDSATSHIYLRLHFVIGVAAIGGFMAVFAKSLADSKARWYAEAMKKKALEAAGDTEGYMDDIVAFLKYYGPKAQLYIYFGLWTVVGVVTTCSTVHWSVLNGIYFSLSCMTTGGLFALPDNIPSGVYIFVSIYIVVGVPLMAVSLGLMASMATNLSTTRSLDAKMSAVISNNELEMMNSFGIEDGDGAVDSKEYAILMLVRIGALAPDLIKTINARFQALDVGNTGSITYNDLQGVPTNCNLVRNIHDEKSKVALFNRKIGFQK